METPGGSEYYNRIQAMMDAGADLDTVVSQASALLASIDEASQGISSPPATRPPHQGPTPRSKSPAQLAADREYHRARRLANPAAVRAQQAAASAARRTQHANDEKETAVEQLLVGLHANSGSTAVANSRRLRTLPPESDEQDEARRDTAADIERHVCVSLDDRARCVARFAERAAVKMRVCGACGLRDPFDECEFKVDLNRLCPEHWLHVGQDALQRLEATAAFDLLKAGADGGYERVRVHRRQLHTMAEVADGAGNGHWYHVVPEALVASSPSGRRDAIHLCKRCSHAFRRVPRRGPR